MADPAVVDLDEENGLSISKGSDYSVVFQHTAASIEAIYGAGNTLESLGFTGKSQIREHNRIDSTLIVEFAVAISGNDITLSLTDTETVAVERSTGYYDLKLTDSADFTTPWYEGEVYFKDGPTDIRES
jgi:hypothetical protein